MDLQRSPRRSGHLREADSAPIAVLIVDDDEEDALLTQDLLEQIDGTAYAAHWVDGYAPARAKLEQTAFDVCLVDYRLGADDGVELVRDLVAEGFDTPIVVLTGLGDRAVDIEATRAGAADYLVKGEVTPALLERTIRYAMRHHADMQALRESAGYLRELRTTFRGSLGLAAAAYNAGPGQVEAWLAGRSRLPFETQAYVRIITGYAAEAWAAQAPPQVPSSNTSTSNTAPGERCVELAKLLIDRPQRRRDLTSDPAWGPWGVQLAGTWSEGRVLATYEQLRRRYNAVLGDRLPLVLYAARRAPSTFIVRVSENSRAGADALCAKLRAAGGACVVFRNPRD